MLEKILALEADVSRLWYHVSVLSKRLYKLDPPRSKMSCAETTPFPAIEEMTLRSACGKKAVEKKEVAEKTLLVAEESGRDEMVVTEEDNVAVVTFETDVMAVEFWGKRRRLENDMRVVDENVVVGGQDSAFRGA